jgi:hypothetical protein
LRYIIVNTQHEGDDDDDDDDDNNNNNNFQSVQYHQIVKKAAHDADGIPCIVSSATPFLSSVIILEKRRKRQYV